ncbi:MAG: peptidylprolyl isomerase [Thermodesulfovibrionales bacterium]|nr:peptidylprolyl isomerase [Thermodesulfovibrionales bacterium]
MIFNARYKRRYTMRTFLWIVIAAAFIASCAKDGQKGDYVAKIDGTKITQEDVQAAIASLPDAAKEFFKGTEGTARFVDEVVKKELLYLEAKKRGLDKNKDLQKKIDEFKKFTIINQLLEKEIEASAKVSDKDIKEYYDKHKDEFMLNNQVRLSHILIKTEGDAKKAAERLQKGEDFAKVAAEMSQDKASAKLGGDIGSFKRGELTPELENVAFRLKKGEISIPIKLKDGFHILKVTDSKGSVPEFDKIKGLISQKLAAERQQKAFDNLIENLKKSYKIDINKDALSKITIAPTPQPAPQKKDK